MSSELSEHSNEQQGESRTETFGDFDLSRALEYLNLFPYQIWDLLFSPVQPSEALKVNLRWEQRAFHGKRKKLR